MNFIPNKGQSELITSVLNWWKTRYKPIYTISGCPGSGKTTTLKYIIEMMGLEMNEVIGIAYSGKAVNVIANNGIPAETIHAFAYVPMLLRLKDEMGEYILNSDGSYKYSLDFVLKDHISESIKLIIIDEISMVPDNMIEDLLSFGVPIIGVGDKDQLPPVFGTCSYILRPDFTLTEIMRQEADNPIIQFCQIINNFGHLRYGQFGSSRVIREFEMSDNLITDYDMIICCTNRTRDKINNFIRKDLYGRPDYPVIQDKIICRQNVKDRTDGKRFLTNGTIGWIDEILPSSRTSKKISIDFVPDYDEHAVFPNVDLDLNFIRSDYEVRQTYGMSRFVKFEYGNVITAHLSQGSEYDRVLFIDEAFGSRELRKKIKYTAISRASKSIDIVTMNP